MNNKITKLFNIKYPIIQGGMIWCSGAKLAAAVSNAGGLGLIGAGSMYPEVLQAHIRKCKTLTDKPFGVNLPLLMGDAEEKINIILSEGVKIIFTSAGNPKTWTSYLKEKGMIVVHIVPGTKYGIKCESAGVDAIVAEGFEAGGHNGREETTTMCLIPKITEEVSIPVIAAGGIGSGKAMAAAFALGAKAVQIGSRFATCQESSAHDNFKQKIIEAKEGETLLMLKKLAPVRLLSNEFAFEVYKQESTGASKYELNELLGNARAKIGMFEGDLQEGELEIGQVSSMIDKLESAGEIVEEVWFEYKKILKKITS
ncbi:MAG: nitronate monooxygenase [Candidatus Cloacimonadota bacterium]|nr:nitronate monooxygenase [Candidatus Cloacimonadota bacterium]